MKTLKAIDAFEIERAERDAWQNMFDVAPLEYRQRSNLFYRSIADGLCLVFPNHPIVHFNMVLGLGFVTPLTAQILYAVERVYAASNHDAYMIQFCHEILQTNPPNLFADMKYRAAGIWERVVWYPQPVAAATTSRAFHIEEVSLKSASEWQQFLISQYHYPIEGWMKGFVTERWHHFVARENKKIVACRSIFINDEGIAWSGVEAPVPMVMTNDLSADFMLWKQIQSFCLNTGVRLIVADIEQPSPKRNTLVYEVFNTLGFEVMYARTLYRKNT